MKHLVYAAVAVSAIGLSAGAFACQGGHSASADSGKMVVAQQQMDGAGTTQGAGTENQSNGAASDESKPSDRQ